MITYYTIMTKHIFDDPDLNKLDPSQYASITDYSLELHKSKQYSLNDLAFVVEHGSVILTSILSSQKSLTADFCVKYILDPYEKYAITDRDGYLDYGTILLHQTHLTFDELVKAYDKI